MLRTFLQSLPEELFEAARMDGAGHLQLYWHIAVPLSVPVLSVLAILNVLQTWNDYIWPLLIIRENALTDDPARPGLPEVGPDPRSRRGDGLVRDRVAAAAGDVRLHDADLRAGAHDRRAQGLTRAGQPQRISSAIRSPIIIAVAFVLARTQSA